jgi:hypothetical protein
VDVRNSSGAELAGGYYVNPAQEALIWAPTVNGMTNPYFAHAMGFLPLLPASGFNMPMMGL